MMGVRKLSFLPGRLIRRVGSSIFMRISRIFLSLLTAAGVGTSGIAHQVLAQQTASPPTAHERVTQLASPDQMQSKATNKAVSGNLLPDNFGGWTLKAPA